MQSLFFGDIMSGFIKIKTKELLLNNTLKLFLVSFTAFILKVLMSAFVILFTNTLLISPFLQGMVIKYNSLLVYFIYSLFTVTLYFILLLFICGLKMGENAIYFMESKMSKAKFKYLFIFLRPSQSFRAFLLYFRLLNLKTLWALFFFSVPIFCTVLIFLLYFTTSSYATVLFTLIIGTAVLTSISLFYYNCSKIRYSYAIYYLCTDFKISVTDAIKKSVAHADNFIKDGVILKSSFLFWLLSCALFFPIFYVIPFTKLSKAKFITFTDALRYSLPQTNHYLLYTNQKSNRIS